MTFLLINILYPFIFKNKLFVKCSDCNNILSYWELMVTNFSMDLLLHEWD